MKGFMFSIESFMAVSVVILATTMLWYSSTLIQQETNNIQIQQQSEEMRTIYFNLPPQQSNPSNYIQYCGKVISYESATKQFYDKNICIGVIK